MKRLLLLLFIFIAPFVSAQETKKPEFPGGQDAIDSFVQANFIYPSDLKPDEVEGQIIVEFWVNSDGGMDSIKVIKNSVNKGADRYTHEAIRVFTLMADNYTWEPGVTYGKKAKAKYHYPIIIKQGEVWIPPKKPELVQEEETFFIVESMPEFPGGQDGINKFISKNVVYPEVAIENDEEGTVYVSFVIRKDGTMTDIKIARTNMSKPCNDEALRVVNKMSKYKWKPGTQRGIAVSTRMILPIKFKLT